MLRGRDFQINVKDRKKWGTYWMTLTTQPISFDRLVKGAATEASASLKLIPTSAAFRAPQSLAPSPQNPTQYPIACRCSTNSCFSSGDMRAKICPLTNILLRVEVEA